MLTPVSIVIPLKFNNDQIYVWGQIRKSADSLDGLIEFPGGKIEAEETPELCAKRETLEETGVKLDDNQLKRFKVYETSVDEKMVQIFVYIYNDLDSIFEDNGWHTLGDLIEAPQSIPPINLSILKDILEYFQ